MRPECGSVAFGSGKEVWAFTVTKMARIYSKKFNTDYKKLMDKFWGDNFYDAKTKKFRLESCDDDGKQLKRCFV